MRYLSLKIPVATLAFVMATASLVPAQPLLSADDAVSIALKNNYGILVARNDAEIAKVNNTLGSAGMLPNVAITGSENYALSSLDQRPVGSATVQSSTAHPNVFGAGARLDWTLFDGGKMFVTRQKLGEIEALGAIFYKDKVLQTVYAVIVAYYDVVRQKQQLASIGEVLTYNKERVTIAKTSFGAGLAPKTVLLQAQVDLNVYKELAINQETVIATSKRTLNGLLSREPEIAFEVTDSIPLAEAPEQ
jgi:outer membrane protein